MQDVVVVTLPNKNVAVVHFGVVMSIARRSRDPGFCFALKKGFASLARQSFQNWTLFLVGDSILPADMARILQRLDEAVVLRERVILHNLEKHSHEGGWEFAGVLALNRGLDIATTFKHITHIARLDDDDSWHSSHLETLATVYSLECPECAFAYTAAEGYFDTEILPWGREGVTSGKNVLPPFPCCVIHSSVSWNPNLLDIRYRNGKQQENTRRSLKRCCSATVGKCNTQPCPHGRVLPADADAWERVAGLNIAGLIDTYFVNNVTVAYTSAVAKSKIHC